jgi:hypothetical protein
MGEEIQGLDPGLLKLGKIKGLDLPLLPTVNTNSGEVSLYSENEPISSQRVTIKKSYA